jgi:flagellar motor switch protein FliN/FliY
VAAIRAQPPAEPASSEDRPVEALDAVLAAAAETLTVTLATQYGMLNVQVDRVDEMPSDKMLLAALSASSGEGQLNTILLSFDEALVDSLTSAHEAKHPAKSKKAAIEPTNLQLVMDVELNVSLRFGQCQLPLRDVLDLNSGSVIELDRDVDDPVELLLDGKVIARGEAVIVDGNYGLRITEIPQPIASHFSSQPFRG